MKQLNDDAVLSDVRLSQYKASLGQIDLKIVPPGEVGSFSEEERSRQVSMNKRYSIYSPFLILMVRTI